MESVYAYVLKWNELDPFESFRHNYVRFVKPFSGVKIVTPSNQEVIQCLGKSGKLLSKSIPVKINYKPDLKVFETKEECYLAYKKDLENFKKALKESYEKKIEEVDFLDFFIKE